MNKKVVLPIVSFVIVTALVVAGIFVSRNFRRSKREVSAEKAEAQLLKKVREIEPTTSPLVKSQLNYTEADEAEDLPELKSSSVTVKASTSTYAEIFSSPEKAEKGKDGWLADMARDFNAEHFEIDGKRISVQIRDVTSGLAMDYIRTEKYSPTGFSPSNMMWVDMLSHYGINTEVITKRMVGNVAIIVLKNETYKKLKETYGAVEVKTIIEATEKGEFVMGYTNPFTSSTGLNFLITSLQRYDGSNPLSDKAIEGFSKFQKNVPFVSVNTVQMRNAAENGTLDGFVLESQLYKNDAYLSKNYTAIPFGYRHDNPLVAIEGASKTEKSILKKFAQYCESDKAKKLADKDGFNQYDNYQYEYSDVDGSTLIQAQKKYKEAKDSGKQVYAVFIADRSGSMGGRPMTKLKQSLINSIPYISSTNAIGLVSYADDVSIDVPLDTFDLTHKSYFKGGVEKMQPSGGTATYDAVCVGAKMLLDKAKENPDAKLMLFVLSDGETNQGNSLSDIKDIIKSLRIPVCTISYNQNESEELNALAAINEAPTIRASSDDVVYQLKNLLNAEM